MTKTITKLLLNGNTYQIKEYDPRITLFDGSSIASGAGIFHQPDKGVISISSDGNNRITIADKNLGATAVYEDGDTLSEANCGKYYQWGNNYGFPFSGSVTESATQVDASTYGPGNYYSSSTFITTTTGSPDWSYVQNDDLWGGVTGTVEAMRGPCTDGYHVSTKDENIALVAAMTALGIDTSNGICMKTYLKMPFAGARSYQTADEDYQGVYAYYWTSTAAGAGKAYCSSFYSGNITPPWDIFRALGYSIRPFKNDPIHP